MAELQEEYGPAVCQSGLRGCNRVSEVEACQEAAAQRQVPQQRWASCPPAAYKNFFYWIPAHMDTMVQHVMIR